MNTQPRTNNLFGEKNHFAALIESVQAPVRSYHHKQARTFYKPDFARFKLKVYFRDGNGKVMFSYDTYKKYVEGKKTTVLDEREGLIKLVRCVNKYQKSDRLISAVIWACVTPEKNTKESLYNFEVVKFVRHKENWFSPFLKFENGILQIQFFPNPK